MGTNDFRVNLLDELLDAVFMVDAEGRIQYASAAWQNILGYSPDELIGRSQRDLIAPEDLARTLAEAEEVMAGKPRIGFENRYVRKDGTLVHLMWSARMAPEIGMRIGVARDVTALRRAEDLRAATYALSEAAQRATSLHGLLHDIHAVAARIVPLEAFAVAMPEGGDGPLVLAYPAEDTHGAAQLVREHERRMLDTDAPLPDHASDGWLVLPLHAAGRAIGLMLLKYQTGACRRECATELLQFVALQAAMAIERLVLHAELLLAARSDELTGLPNRRRFAEQVEHALVRAMRSGATVALLFIDLNDFKLINDRLGHAAGDHVLRTLAGRMQGCLREEDSVARLGGDEFAVLLDQVTDLDAAYAVAAKLRNAAAAAIAWESHTVTPRLAIGVAAAPDHGFSLDQLLRHADQAMYQEKQQRKLRQD